jgi:hypothetical protein
MPTRNSRASYQRLLLLTQEQTKTRKLGQENQITAIQFPKINNDAEVLKTN